MVILGNALFQCRDLKMGQKWGKTDNSFGLKTNTNDYAIPRYDFDKSMRDQIG